MRRAITAGLIGLSIALAGAVPAGASLAQQGFTWYTAGGYGASGPPSTVITAYATRAKPNTTYVLQTSAPRGAFPCSDVLLGTINPNVRTSTANGFIGPTSGAVNRDPGDYEVCFYAIPRLDNGHSPTATWPATFTVV